MNSKKCKNHNQDVIFQNTSQSDLSLRNLCQICVVEMKNNNNLVLISDIEETLTGLQRGLIQEVDDSWNQKVSQISHLRDNIQNIGRQVSILIEKFIKNSDDFIKRSQQINEQFKMQILDLPLTDNQQFIQKYQELKIHFFSKDTNKNLVFQQLGLPQIAEYLNQLQNAEAIFDQEEPVYSKIIKDYIQYSQQTANAININCEKHDNEILMVDLNEIKTIPNRLACLSCVEEYPIKYTRLQKVQELWQIYRQHQQNELNTKKIILKQEQAKQQQIMSEFKQQFENLIKKHQVEQDRNNQIYLKQIDLFEQKAQEKWNLLSELRIVEITDIISQPNNLEIMKDNLQRDFDIWNQSQKAYFNFFSLSALQVLKDFNPLNEQPCIKQPIDIGLQQNQFKNQFYQYQDQSPFKYELLKQNSIKTQDIVYTIAINQNQSLVVVGCRNLIKIFQFQLELLNQIQIICEHQEDVNCLIFLKDNTSFISGSDDNSIRIWKINQSNYWYCQNQLIGHLKSIYCILINTISNLIISCSGDSTIKFWGEYNFQSLCIQTITGHDDIVFSLDLNEGQNKLISCGADQKILIIDQNDQNWIISQIISIERVGYRICFIDDNLFFYQPSNHNNLYFYSRMEEEFILKCQIPVLNGDSCDFLFQPKFLKDKSLLMCKNGSCVNFFKINSTIKVTQEYSINFQDPQIFGTLSDDGRYLITWDAKSIKLQIRKYTE